MLVWLSPQTIVSPGKRQAQFRADHVDDPLMAALDVVERDAELPAVGPQRFYLPARQGIADVELVIGRDVMIDRRKRQVRSPDPAPGQPEPVERLRAGHLMDQVAVDVQERRLLRRGDHMAIPDFLEQGLRHV